MLENTTAQKLKYSLMENFIFFVRICSHLLKKSLMETSFFVQCTTDTKETVTHDDYIYHEKA